MDDKDLYIINVIYLLFLIIILGSAYYFFGWNAMWFLVFVLILFSIFSLYIGYINSCHVSDNIRYNYNDNPREIFINKANQNKPFDANEILKKRDDIVNNVDLNESKFHDIDE